MNKLYVNFSDEIFKIDDKDYQDFQMDKYTKVLKNYLMCKSKEKDVFGYIVTRNKTIYPIIVINDNNELIKIKINISGQETRGFTLLNIIPEFPEDIIITMDHLYEKNIFSFINQINEELSRPIDNNDYKIMAWVVDK